MTAYTATLIDVPVIPFDLYTVTGVGYAHFAATMLDFPKLNEPAYALHGVFWPTQPATHPAITPFNPTHITGLLDTNTTETGMMTATESFVVNGISTSAQARVRMYTTIAKRDADLARAIGTDPVGDHGLLFEVVTTTGQLSYQVSPGVYIFTDSPVVPITVTNLSGSAQTVTVTISAIVLE